jgi:hypothetical protein
MFKDESVSITQSIKNVKDLGKIFTEFTKTFTLPASKANNKLFKHYYNFDIVGGFDARTKKSATIELNHLPFKKGKIKLDGVELKNRKPYMYKVTFYGNTVDLKDIIGDDKLSSLDLSPFNQEYSATRVEDLLKTDFNNFDTGTVTTVGSSQLIVPSTTGVSVGDQVYNVTTNQSTTVVFIPTSTVLSLDDDIFQTVGDTYEISNHIVCPLITNTKRLFYESTASGSSTGNLWYHGGSGGAHQHGVSWKELKYALRAQKIIDAIERKYTTSNGYATDISFSNDFLNKASNPRWFNLYMWLHRKSGKVESGTVLPKNPSPVDGWNDETGSYDFCVMSNNVLSKWDEGTREIYDWKHFRLTVTSASSALFDLEVLRNGTRYYFEEDIDLSSTSGTKTIDFTPTNNGDYTVVIYSTSSIIFTDIEWSIRHESCVIGNCKSRVTTTDTFNTSDVGNFTADGTNFTFIASNQVPEMKVIDFLTGVFKMFNLVALVEDDGEIYVDTLDNFYTDKKSISTAYDISKYVDVQTMQVDAALPYSEVNFRYEDTKTYLAVQHEQLFGKGWGKEEYSERDAENNQVDGGIYDIKVPFGHLKYENLYDLDDNTKMTLQWGWSVDESQSPQKGSPVLFYPVYEHPQKGGTDVSIAFVTIDDDGVYGDHTELDNEINMPSNSIGFLDVGTGGENINFFAEVNEQAGEVFEDTLFQDFYRTYIEDVFNNKRRLTKVKAYLPMKILLNFTLADRFDINGQRYKINSIETNLATGESNIELLNEV